MALYVVCDNENMDGCGKKSSILSKRQPYADSKVDDLQDGGRMVRRPLELILAAQFNALQWMTVEDVDKSRRSTPTERGSLDHSVWTVCRNELHDA